MGNSDFYTLKGYARAEKHFLSPAMEDYLEMICRYSGERAYVRVGFLAGKLNVTPPSASKMVGKLKSMGLLEFEPYGLVRPTAKGWEIGRYLLRRHEVLNEFFCLVNRTDNVLKQVEKIEHFMEEDTVRNMERLLPFLKTLEEKKD